MKYLKRFESLDLSKAPPIIMDQLVKIHVDYINFNGKLCSGNIECNHTIKDDLSSIFGEILEIEFPMCLIRPISEFDNDDYKSVVANNTSCFNWRFVIGGNKLSDHSLGLAIDINPMQNPWVHPSAHKIEGRKYDPSSKGTITQDVVDIFKKYNFRWGGDWKNPDYQHFFKPNEELKKDILSNFT